MKHIHHIIPKHAGGTNDPSNLVELSVEEHAEAHRLLYEQYGREEDRIAWLALSGQASKKEAVLLGKKLGRKKTNEILHEKYGSNWRRIIALKGNEKSIIAFRKKIKEDKAYALKIKQNSKKGRDAALSDKAKQKRKNTFSLIKHQQGERNSNYGKMWIYNDLLKKNKLILKNEPIPSGWVKGRKINF